MTNGRHSDPDQRRRLATWCLSRAAFYARLARATRIDALRDQFAATAAHCLQNRLDFEAEFRGVTVLRRRR